MITLATICLNEEEFIGAWLDCHYASFDRIIICEGAARNYPRTAVSGTGLSIDRTAEIVRGFPDPRGKIRFVQHGWAGPEVSIDDRVPAKMELRNVYAKHIESGYAFTLDMDEFLHPSHIDELVNAMEEEPELGAYAIPQLHLWQTTRQYITGRYADMPHFRLYRWKAGSRYVYNHNWPSAPGGALLTANGKKAMLAVSGGELSGPAIIHYGFCERKSSMAEKNLYYAVRGEETTRPATTEFRRAALSGKPIEGCAVHPYRGFLPFEPACSGKRFLTDAALGAAAGR
jgi:hypothetical protein